jgi:putative FmdB family regulatory protein
MPIHEYTCDACGHEFEELVRTDGQKILCPKCGGAKLARKLSTFAAVVAASGPSCRQTDACPRSSCCSGGACPHSH